MAEFNLLINGQLVAGDATMDVINPATEETVATCARASIAQLDQAVAAAKAAFPAWSKTSIDTRRAALIAMAEKLKYDALVALGCIVRGETYHFELVANESGAGVSRVSLDYQLPIANAILTTENMEQAIARQTEKGRDAARVAVEMANLLEAI